MADLVLANFVKETSTTTGTGTYSLAGAATGHQGFVAGVGGGSKVPYFVTDGTNWEHGLGTVTDAATDTLSRDKIYASSNAGAAVNWGAGTRDIYVARGANPGNAIHTITGATTLSYIHRKVLCNSASAFTVTLPAAAEFQGRQFTITNINTGKVTIDGNSTETIRDPVFGSAETLDLWVLYDSVTIESDGSAWYVVQRNFAPHRVEVSLAAATSFTSATATQVNFDTIEFQIGASADLAETDEILINRSGNYILTAQSAFDIGSGQWMYIDVKTTSGTLWMFNRVFSSGTATAYMNIAKRVQITAGTRIGMFLWQNGSTQNTRTSTTGRPILSASEVC